MTAAAISDFLGYVERKMSLTRHQILQDNALDIGLYNSLLYRTSRVHGLYGSTSCSHSVNVSKVAVTTLVPNMVP